MIVLFKNKSGLLKIFIMCCQERKKKQLKNAIFYKTNLLKKCQLILKRYIKNIKNLSKNIALKDKIITNKQKMLVVSK